MSIWGKVVGGAAGFAIGGPIGGLLGALAGHAVDRHMREADNEGENTEGTQQISFTIGVIVLSAKMAKADGQVTRDEIDVFRRAFHVPEHELKNVGRLFNQAKQDARGFEPYARQLATLFQDRPAVLEDLLDILFHIARADGVIHPAELTFLREVAAIFGFPETEFERIRASHLGADRADPYTVLGVEPSVTDTELKKHYRQLIKEHHPDRLIAQGMPPEFIDVANDKLAAINTAYDAVCKQRGLS
ncbi:MAG: molecular chaperone DjlA [Kordiimonas sp.]|nr:molecular chaperone DjlA [Kordiimonas sp.]|tara:strand:- start:4963 stop:5700 length:738 start_codon:yes stop_codon:yes gene_type:complete